MAYILVAPGAGLVYLADIDGAAPHLTRKNENDHHPQHPLCPRRRREGRPQAERRGRPPLHHPQGRPAVVAYAGKSAKPAMWLQFSSEAAREKRVTAFFAGRAATLAYKAERKAAQNKPHKLQLGHVLVASWGYDQTNVDFFEVTKVVGPHTVEVRPIRSIIDPTLVDQGRALPKGGDYTGPATRHRVTNGDRVKIDDVRRAGLWDGRPMSWSSYH